MQFDRCEMPRGDEYEQGQLPKRKSIAGQHRLPEQTDHIDFILGPEGPACSGFRQSKLCPPDPSPLQLRHPRNPSARGDADTAEQCSVDLPSIANGAHGHHSISAR